MPGIVAAALLAFTLSLDDFVITFFVAGPGSTTLPVRVYSMIKFGVTPEVNADFDLDACWFNFVGCLFAAFAAGMTFCFLDRRRK